MSGGQALVRILQTCTSWLHRQEGEQNSGGGERVKDRQAHDPAQRAIDEEV